MFNNKKILITGGTGSWGQELIDQLLKNYYPKEIRVYSRSEHKQVQTKLRFGIEPRIRYIIGDVRDKKRLKIALEGVNYVFHLAALKHVPICEENPWEAVLTNIVGTRNLIEAAIENKVDKVVSISTDKAVDPLNIYGTTKACGEKLIIAANTESEHTSFVSIRGGNVIGTNGSVVPLFREQILKNNEITLTDKRMTRFFFSLKQAIELVFKAANDSVGGEVFVMKMPSAKITELAQVMIDSLGDGNTKVKEIGIRPGEKIHEVLVSRYETPYCIDSDKYYIILPQINLENIKKKYENMQKVGITEFTSENTYVMNKEKIKDILTSENWLLKERREGDGTYYGKKISPEELKEVFKREGWFK